MAKELVKNKTGRPTNYNKNFCVLASRYLKEFQKDEPVPTIAGLACFLKIPRQKIYEYKGQYEEFRDIVDNLLSLQEKKLVAGSLNNKLNSKISALMLAKHGYKNEEIVENKSKVFILD